MTYTLEFDATADVTDFTPYGGNEDLIYSHDPEVIVEGPAETGKTLAACWKSHLIASKYPGAQGAILRKTQASIYGSVLQTFQRVIAGAPINPYGGEKPEKYIYPNGSVVWIGGMDNRDRVLSSERDFVQTCQTEEFTVDDWEYLTTRTTGRGAVIPYPQLYGDCNPGGSSHWIKQRAKAGHLRLIHTTHRDNPTLYSRDGSPTPQGHRTIARLSALTGIRRKRLYEGIWATAEGAVYDEYDPNIHLIDADKLPEFVRRFRVVDFGYSNPFVCQWWGMDADGRLYRYREMYVTRQLVEDLTPKILALSKGESIETTVADHDAEDRATMEKHGIGTIPAKKDVSPGIQAVKARLKVQPDGKPRLYFVRGALVEVDPLLQELKKPTCTEDEIEGYIWQKYQDGRPNKEQPLKVDDHGCDDTRYIVMYVDNGEQVTTETNPFYDN